MDRADLLRRPSVRTAVFVMLACIGALASRYAVPFAFRYSMSFLPLGVAVLLFLLYRARLAKVLRASRASLRFGITCAVVALLFSFFLVIGSWQICEDSGDLSWIHGLATVANALPLFVLIVMFMEWLDGLSERIRRARRGRAFRLTPKGCLIVFAVLLICWLPIFLAGFPGFFCYDMTSSPESEYAQFESGNLNGDYPTFHVLLLGFLITLGQSITGSFNGGVALYICLQMLVMSALFTVLVRSVANASASKGLTLATVAYLGLNPMVSLFVMCTTRDSLFSAFAVLFVVLLFAFFRDPSTRTEVRAGQLVALGITAILVCFLRPNGLVAIIVLMPFLILFMKGARARLAMGGMCAAVLVVCGLWFGPVAGALGVQPSTTARLLVLSLPAQQIANVMDSDEIQLNERKMLLDAGFGEREENGDVMMFERWPQLADSARWNLERMSTEDILAAYVMLGFSHPQKYFEAFVDQTQAAWSPYAYARVYLQREENPPYGGRISTLFELNWEEPASSESLAPGLLAALEEVSGQLPLQNVPLVSLLVAVPFYLWVLILLMARAIITLDKRIAAPCVFLAILTLTALCGPAVLMRYYLPIIFALPLMVTMLASAPGKE